LDHEIPDGKKLIDPAACWLIADILSDKTARAPSFSTGSPLDLPFPCAVKTGTSSDFRDNWCVGFTPGFTVGVWAGNFENQPMKNISGVSGAGPIFHRSLVRAHRDTPPTWFARPEGGETVEIDTRTGKRLAADAHPKFSAIEWLPPGTGIPTAAPSDYDEYGRAILPAIYADWFASNQNLRRHELAPAIGNDIPFEILRPRDQSTFLLDPELPGSGSGLKLLTNLPEQTAWTSETLTIQGDTAKLTPGTHILIATDKRDGKQHRVTITVKHL
jgi:penicillin-binding protein 1C